MSSHVDKDFLQIIKELKEETLADQSISKGEKAKVVLQSEMLVLVKDQIKTEGLKADVKQSTQQLLMERLALTDNNAMTNPELIKLLEVLNKGDNEVTLGILGLMKDQQQVGEGPAADPGGKITEQDSGFTADEVKNVKNLLMTVSKVKKLQEFKEEVEKTEM